MSCNRSGQGAPRAVVQVDYASGHGGYFRVNDEKYSAYDDDFCVNDGKS
jgi:hypothetical protein